MVLSKTIVVVFFLCFVHECVSKPTTEHDIGEGRGIVSSIWGWISYPFYWWGSGDTEQPVTDQPVGSTTSNPNDIDVRRHNVTIWCNDQTCTTMKCNKVECRNITCNLYDTDFRGECREYNFVTEENIVSKPTETTPDVSVQNKPTETMPDVSVQNKPTETMPDVSVQNKPTETMPEISVQNKPTETMPEVSVQNKPTETMPETGTPSKVISNGNTNVSTADKPTLKREAVLSSVVNTQAEVKTPNN